MDRRAVSRNVRRLSPFFVLVAVLALLAGGLPALLSQPSGGGSHGGLAVQAPGSNGSVHSLPSGERASRRRMGREASDGRGRG